MREFLWFTPSGIITQAKQTLRRVEVLIFLGLLGGSRQERSVKKRKRSGLWKISPAPPITSAFEIEAVADSQSGSDSQDG